MRCRLIGIPLRHGSRRRGCEMGPAAFRVAGLAEALESLGHEVCDLGDLAIGPVADVVHPNTAIHDVSRIAAWTEIIAVNAIEASRDAMPIFLGGDHALTAGSMTGMAQAAKAQGRPFFVLWLDAHPDFHTLTSTQSGNLHGVPMAYAVGRPGFDGWLPALKAPIDPANIHMIGIRSVDHAEREALGAMAIHIEDMRAIDEHGVSAPLGRFLERIKAANGLLHVSLDVDFLDPMVAPAVGTTVPGGVTLREAHLIMEMLHDSGLVTSLDLAELNPFLDERGRTAIVLVDLAASLMGRKVLDRPTRGHI